MSPIHEKPVGATVEWYTPLDLFDALPANYQRALEYAHGVCLLRDRLWFVRSDGFQARSSFGSTLFAFGEWAVGILRAADLGWFVDLRPGHLLAVPA